MKHFAFDSHWDEIKGKLKQRYAQLTDHDLVFIEGKAEELLGRLREKLGLSAGELDALLKETRATVASHVKQAKAKSSELADDIRERAGALADDAKEQAGVVYEQARERARSLREDCEDYVRQNPRESLVGALCAGFVAGLLIRR